MKPREVICGYCSQVFFKEVRRINESNKKGWVFFCSKNCRILFHKTSVLKKCSREGCCNIFLRVRSQIKTGNSYCSRSCSASANNHLFPKRICNIKECAQCIKKFKGNKKYCSHTCHALSQIIPSEKIISDIRLFYKKNGRIPMKREFNHYHATRARFGTWNNAIQFAGFRPNIEIFAKKHIAKDGHKCDSFSEKLIDDWLFANDIKHTRSVKYPGNEGFSVDFLVADFWIEFFGLDNQLSRYDQLKKRKIKLAKKYELKLVDLYPKDLFPKFLVDKKLHFLIK